MREELGCEVSVSRLLWVAENFFILEGRSYHEVSFIHWITPEDHRILDPDWTREVTPVGEHNRLEFVWTRLDSLAEINLKPEFLRKRLREPPEETTRLIVRE